MIISRRRLLGGLGFVFAAPAIVRVESLMKILPLRRDLIDFDSIITWDKDLVTVQEAARILSNANALLEIWNQNPLLLHEISVSPSEWRKIYPPSKFL